MNDAPYSFQPKLCRRCGDEFTPRSGAQKDCDACRQKPAPVSHSTGPRQFKKRKCVACQGDFVPRGARQEICIPCREEGEAAVREVRQQAIEARTLKATASTVAMVARIKSQATTRDANTATDVPDCGYCRMRGAPCIRHGGEMRPRVLQSSTATAPLSSRPQKSYAEYMAEGERNRMSAIAKYGVRNPAAFAVINQSEEEAL